MKTDETMKMLRKGDMFKAPELASVSATPLKVDWPGTTHYLIYVGLRLAKDDYLSWYVFDICRMNNEFKLYEPWHREEFVAESFDDARFTKTVVRLSDDEAAKVLLSYDATKR
jgi:hypothetical protein